VTLLLPVATGSDRPSTSSPAAGSSQKPNGYRTHQPGVRHQVPALLSAPVGNRVYVDLHGHAGEVVKPADRGWTR
jgi:hypothetical protein